MITKEQALKEIGLSEKEIKVYLASLKLGQDTANEIAKKSSLNRVTTYDVLKALIEKGFASYVIKAGVKYFEAVDPSKFIDNLKEKQEKVKSILPELESMKASLVKKPEIETFEGLEGLKTIFSDILKESKETLFIGDPKMLDRLEFYFPHFIMQKRKQKIFSKVITTDVAFMRDYKKKAPKKALDMRFINQKIDMTKVLYGEKVAFLTFKEDMSIGVLIDNKEIAETEKMLFDLLWSKAKV